VQAVLVTGGAGYIGSHTCKALAQAGLTPVTLDNLVYGHRHAVKWGPFIEGDLADRALLERVMREHSVQAVIHFAAYAYVGESMQQPGKYFANNVVNTLNLLDAMHNAGVQHIVFSSTCATYGLPERVPIDEQHPQKPVNPYGESKLFVERALKWYEVAHGLKWAALRYFNAAGADADGEIGEDHTPETHLIPLIIQAALGMRSHVEVFGTDYATPDGTAIRDYIHVTDLGDAHVKAVEYLFGGGSSVALNLGTGRGYSVREVISSVERVSGRSVPTRNAPRRPGDPPELVANAAQAGQQLGWYPQHSSLENITRTAWVWHQAQREIATARDFESTAQA
jgi:UDP-glucose-4-epimerase GalE